MFDELDADQPLSSEQRSKVAALTAAQLKAIDETLLSSASEHWQKVARLVGSAMWALKDQIFEIPDVYFSERIRGLVEQGLLESFGDLSRMRYSEVRIPKKP